MPATGEVIGGFMESPLIKSLVLAGPTLGERPGGGCWGDSDGGVSSPREGEPHPAPPDEEAQSTRNPRAAGRGVTGRPASPPSVRETQGQARATTRRRRGASRVWGSPRPTDPRPEEGGDGQMEKDVGTDLPSAAPSPESKSPLHRTFLRQRKELSENVTMEGFRRH